MEHGSRISWRALMESLLVDVERRSSREHRDPRTDDLWIELRRQLVRFGSLSLRMPKRTGSQDLEDLVQRVLLKLQDAAVIRRALASDNVTAYVLTMLSNEAREIGRVARRQHDALIESQDPTGPAFTREWLAEEHELPAYLSQLSDDDRKLLALRFWGNLSVQEVADRLQLSYSATAVRYFRVFSRLRAVLEGERDIPPGFR